MDKLKINLLYYVPAFGSPNLEKKDEILMHNINYIYNNINEVFDVCIGFYTICDDIKNKLESIKFINKLHIYEKDGVLTELFLTNPYNSQLSKYDYIIFILDDVKILNMDFKNMIEIKNKYNIEFLSPKILNSTHNFMHKYSELTINNFLEVYLLLFTPDDFYKFCSIHTVENKWMWGVDYLFGYFNIKAGVINDWIANHELKSNSNNKEAIILMMQYLITHTKYKNLNSIKKDYLPINEIINK